MLPRFKPLRLLERDEPFDDPDWLFELKHDGFRALAYLEAGECRLVSRNRYRFEEFSSLARELARTLEGREAVLDGEIVCLDEEGRSQFYELLSRQKEPFFYAFDLLWLDGEDLSDLPLVERKSRLKALVPETPSRLLFADHIEGAGTALFEKICALDLEGIIAKRRNGLYREATRWLKIKNRSYSQAEGRRELFDLRRSKKRGEGS